MVRYRQASAPTVTSHRRRKNGKPPVPVASSNGGEGRWAGAYGPGEPAVPPSFTRPLQAGPSGALGSEGTRRDNVRRQPAQATRRLAFHPAALGGVSGPPGYRIRSMHPALCDPVGAVLVPFIAISGAVFPQAKTPARAGLRLRRLRPGPGFRRVTLRASLCFTGLHPVTGDGPIEAPLLRLGREKSCRWQKRFSWPAGFCPRVLCCPGCQRTARHRAT